MAQTPYYDLSIGLGKSSISLGDGKWTDDWPIDDIEVVSLAPDLSSMTANGIATSISSGMEPGET